RIHPHAGVFADLHVADDLRRLIDIARRMNARRDSLIGTKHTSPWALQSLNRNLEGNIPAASAAVSLRDERLSAPHRAKNQRVGGPAQARLPARRDARR